MKYKKSTLIKKLLNFNLIITSYLLPLFPYFFNLKLLTNIQYTFKLPFYSTYQNQFSTKKQNLSLKIIQYFSNFIKSKYITHYSPKPYHVFPPIPIPKYKNHIFFLNQSTHLNHKNYHSLLPFPYLNLPISNQTIYK